MMSSFGFVLTTGKEINFIQRKKTVFYDQLGSKGGGTFDLTKRGVWSQ